MTTSETEKPRRCGLTKKWDRPRCKRNATTYAKGFHLCEQHAKIILGLPAISGVPAVMRVPQ